MNVVDASGDEKVAFFINIYNALVIHANVAFGPPVNLWQRYKVRELIEISTQYMYRNCQVYIPYILNIHTVTIVLFKKCRL